LFFPGRLEGVFGISCALLSGFSHCLVEHAVYAMTEPFERELAVFSAARRLPAGERGAYLDQTCSADPALRRRVEELLRAGADAEGFLNDPAPGALRPEGPVATSSLIVNTAAPGEKAGDRIGRYKLLQLIGEGGCGLVYMAEQEEPVRRRVALKVIKLGMDTKSVIARFEAERQALAMMDHPNIARVLDAGATDTGRPYFVMELVRGIKITDYCDEHHLSTKERLELFIQVCYAVQHAHQKGVIHRDLKPSNILVARPDPNSSGVPKVIDFGIAKATQGRLTDQTLFTAFEQFIGTPAYMSPEQAELTMQDVDTRTDIYSLGVLLYELLIGRTPFDTQELLASGLDVMRRTIREREPQRPSTRLSTMLRDELTTTAKHRHTESVKLIHSLRGDLDWIVMKCLEKDRARRYDTANGLANDVRRHLNCEPVVARPPSRLYEFQKTVRRHKFGFAAGGAVMALLLIGLVVSTWLLGKERAAHRRAVAAEQAAESGRRNEAAMRQRAELAEGKATEELWHSYLAQARAARFSGQSGRRFDSLEALRKAAAIRFSPELRDEAIACLALPDLKLRRRVELADPKLAHSDEANHGVFDCQLERYACVLTNSAHIIIRSATNDQDLFQLPPPEGAREAVALGKFSHNGRFLPVWYGDHSLRVWDLKRRVTVLAVPVTHRFDCVDFQPDDGRLAVPGPGTVSLYPLVPDQKYFSFPAPFDAAWVRFDPSGHKLALASSSDHRLPILDAGSGAVLLVLTNAEGLYEVAWHPHSPIVAATGGATGLVYVWDTATGRQIFALKGHQSTPSNVAFSHDGDILISSGWDGTHLWHARAGEHLMSCLELGELQSFAPDDAAYGHTVYRGASLELLSFAPGREARRLHASEEDLAQKVLAFSSDGRWLAFAAGEVVELFDAHSTELLATLPTGQLLGMCFQPADEGLVVSGEHGLFRWPIRHGTAAGELGVGPPEAIDPQGVWRKASFSQNGRVFAAMQNERVHFFDAATLRKIALTDPFGYPGQYHDLSLSLDGLRAATCGHHDEVVKIWDTQTGRLVKELQEPDWAPEGSAHPLFDPNGRSLVIASWYNYRIFDTDSWAAGPPLPRSGLPVVALSHGGAMLATSDEGQTSIQLRDITTGELLATLQSAVPTHMGVIEFSPDDTQIAVAYQRAGELLVWDLRRLREELRGMGLDWARPPYPPAAAGPAPKAFHLRVLTNSPPSATGG
jgi:serine/threonine protein kinase/WD40 repeat protein